MTRPGNALDALRPGLASAAQAVYDEWDVNDDDLGGGGICDLIADAQVGYLAEHGIEAKTTTQAHGENHIYVLAQTQGGVYEVNIPPNVYETGGGYSWEKIPDVTIRPSDVFITLVDADPATFDDYGEE